jgi:hypothetical protein
MIIELVFFLDAAERPPTATDIAVVGGLLPPLLEDLALVGGEDVRSRDCKAN